MSKYVPLIHALAEQFNCYAFANGVVVEHVGDAVLCNDVPVTSISLDSEHSGALNGFQHSFKPINNQETVHNVLTMCRHLTLHPDKYFINGTFVRTNSLVNNTVILLSLLQDGNHVMFLWSRNDPEYVYVNNDSVNQIPLLRSVVAESRAVIVAHDERKISVNHTLINYELTLELLKELLNVQSSFTLGEFTVLKENDILYLQSNRGTVAITRDFANRNPLLFKELYLLEMMCSPATPCSHDLGDLLTLALDLEQKGCMSVSNSMVLFYYNGTFIKLHAQTSTVIQIGVPVNFDTAFRSASYHEMRAKLLAYWSSHELEVPTENTFMHFLVNVVPTGIYQMFNLLAESKIVDADIVNKLFTNLRTRRIIDRYPQFENKPMNLFTLRLDKDDRKIYITLVGGVGVVTGASVDELRQIVSASSIRHDNNTPIQRQVDGTTAELLDHYLKQYEINSAYEFIRLAKLCGYTDFEERLRSVLLDIV